MLSLSDNDQSDIIEAFNSTSRYDRVGYQYPISLEVNRNVSHIPLSKLEGIPLIKFPKYPVSLEVNKISLKLQTQNRPTSTGTFCSISST